jgi:tRNA modification GTPase
VVDASVDGGGWREAAGLVREGDLLVLNKADLGAGVDRAAALAHAADRGARPAEVSVSNGAGLDALHGLFVAAVTSALSGADFPAATRIRHRERLAEARDHIARAITVVEAGAELAAEDVRLAGRALGRVTGRIDPESVLDRIFSSFCIGK